MSDEFVPLLTEIASSSNSRIKLRYENYSHNMGAKFFKICKNKLCAEENSIKTLQDRLRQLEDFKTKLQTNLERANQASVLNKEYALLLEEKLQNTIDNNKETLLKAETCIARFQQGYKKLVSRYEGLPLAVELKNLEIDNKISLIQLNKLEKEHIFYKSRLQNEKEEHKNISQQQIIQLAYYIRHKRKVEILKQKIQEKRLKYISFLTANKNACAAQENVTKNIEKSKNETAVDLSQFEAIVTSFIREKPAIIAKEEAVLESSEKENVEIKIVDPPVIIVNSLAERETIKTGENIAAIPIETSNENAIAIEDHDNIDDDSVEISDPQNQEPPEVDENTNVMELKHLHIKENVILTVEQTAEIVSNLDGAGTIVTHIGMDIETPSKAMDIDEESEANTKIFIAPENDENKENETVSKFFGKNKDAGDIMEENCTIKKPKLDLNYQMGEQRGRYLTTMEKELQCFDTQSSYPENTLGSPISDISSNIDGKYLTNFLTITSPEPEKTKEKVQDVGPTTNFESLFTGHSFRKPSTTGNFDFQSQFSNKSDNNTPMPFFQQQQSDVQKEPNNKFKSFFLF